ncbi:MAG: hypothetical protein KAX38_01740 [Candidatus Krumholzibacteria bacterium]|nr:hypothetical protein [Candidatus Krumholzibacteria bacterium]
MSSGREFVIGGKTDPVGIVQLGRILKSLDEVHPRSRFIDFRDSKCVTANKKNRSISHKGLFGILQMLLRNEIDIVVANACEILIHLQSKIKLAAVPKRSNPFDVLISREEVILDDQPEEACLAIENPLRKGQLLYYRPDLKFVEESGDFDALYDLVKKGKVNGFIQSASDVEALNRQDKVAEVFTSSICMPAAGQGALGILIRKDDGAAQNILRALNDSSSFAEIELEKIFIERVSRNGRGPVGVLASVDGDEFRIEAAISALDGSEKVSGTVKGRSGEEARIVEKFAEELLASGGDRIIKAFNESLETG